MNSENEVEQIGSFKKEFLNNSTDEVMSRSSSTFEVAVIVGISYLLDATALILPMLVRAKSVFWPLAVVAVVMAFIWTVIAFAPGMRMSGRILTNLVILIIAASATYTIGIFSKISLWNKQLTDERALP